MWAEKVKTGYKFVERYRDPLTGQIRRTSVVMDKDTAQTRKVAQRAIDAKIQAAVGDHEPVADITLEKLAEQYIAEQKMTKKEATTRRNCFMAQKALRVFGKNTLVSALNANYIRTKLIALDEKPDAKNEILKRFKGMLRWGFRHDLTGDVSYLDKIERFKAPPHREKIEDKYLEASELSDLLDDMQHPIWKAVTKFLVLSGLRFGEFAALKKSDVDLQERMIHVSMTYDPNNKVETEAKTYDSCRDVYMQDELIAAAKELKLLMMKQKVMHGYSTNLYMCRKDGSHVSYYAYNKYLQENALRVIGKKITPHALRHTHVSLLAENGINIDTISRRIGHSDSEITKSIYLHITEKLKEKENEQLKGLKII